MYIDEEKEDVADIKGRLQKIMDYKEAKKQRTKHKRLEAFRKMTKMMKNIGKNVVYPTYHFDDRLKIHREDPPPSKDVFLAVGYDPKFDSKQKHYRRFYEDELENIKEVIPSSPFQSFPVMRGQSRGLSKGFFWKRDTDEAGQATTIKQVGEFKGIVSVINKDREEGFNVVKETRITILKQSLNDLSQKLFQEDFDFDYKTMVTAEGKETFRAKLKQLGCDNLQIERHFTQMNCQAELARLMMIRTNCLVRIYILDADELPPKDSGGSVDPYLKLKLNGEVISDRDNYKESNHNPDIYKMFEFMSEFPGCSSLKIQMWDYDLAFGDDFIGETVVDLEDRFFSPEWQSIKDKPIEYRQLYHKSTKVSQGVLKCWIEILPSESNVKEHVPWNISQRPNTDFVIRLVVWETKDIKTMDWEGTSDIYCRAFFIANDKDKRTDTHYRSMDGKGSFNYRMLFNVQNPSQYQRLNLQVWDADLFSGNDFIADSSLNLALPIEDATLTDKPIHLNKKYYDSFLKEYMGGQELKYHDDDSFWVDMKNREGEDGGKMRIQITVAPKEYHETNKNAEARTEPNHSPYLPPPVGRIKFSWNPWTMLNQCVAPDVRNKIL